RPGVEVDAKPVERPFDLLEHPGDRVVVTRRELVDVRAAVAVVGWLLSAPPRLDRGTELFHLRTGVVVVVLALDLVARELEQARNRVAVGAVPSRSDSDRAGRARSWPPLRYAAPQQGGRPGQRPATASADPNKSSSRRSSSSVPAAIITSPASSGRSGSGVVSKWPSRLRTATMTAPVLPRMRSSPIVFPACAQPAGTSSSSKRRSAPAADVTTSMKAVTCGFSIRFAITRPAAEQGWTTRSAPAIRSFLAAAALEARATTSRSGRTARAEGVM